jgi:hypothetical protein
MLITDESTWFACSQPEWAFSSVLDTIYEQRTFAETYLQALVSRTGTVFKDVDAVVSFF